MSTNLEKLQLYQDILPRVMPCATPQPFTGKVVVMTVDPDNKIIEGITLPHSSILGCSKANDGLYDLEFDPEEAHMATKIMFLPTTKTIKQVDLLLYDDPEANITNIPVGGITDWHCSRRHTNTGTVVKLDLPGFLRIPPVEKPF